MNAKPVLASRHAGTSILVAALSSGITIGILAGITNLFVHDGAPLSRHSSPSAPAPIMLTYPSARVACAGSWRRLICARSRVVERK